MGVLEAHSASALYRQNPGSKHPEVLGHGQRRDPEPKHRARSAKQGQDAAKQTVSAFAADSTAVPTWVEPLEAGAELLLKRPLFPAHPTRPSRKAPTPQKAAGVVFLWEDRSRSGAQMHLGRTLTPGSALYDVWITNRLSEESNMIYELFVTT